MDSERVGQLTTGVMEVLKECSVEEALTIVTNVAGHLCAHLANGVPSAIQRHGNSISEAIKSAAVAKIIHDNSRRVKRVREENEKS